MRYTGGSRDYDRGSWLGRLSLILDIATGLVLVYMILLAPGTIGMWAMYQGELMVGASYMLLQFVLWAMFGLLNVL